MFSFALYCCTFFSFRMASSRVEVERHTSVSRKIRRADSRGRQAARRSIPRPAEALSSTGRINFYHFFCWFVPWKFVKMDGMGDDSELWKFLLSSVSVGCTFPSPPLPMSESSFKPLMCWRTTFNPYAGAIRHLSDGEIREENKTWEEIGITVFWLLNPVAWQPWSRLTIN